MNNVAFPLCFVAMPFRSDLNYFYLYVRRHLQEHHALRVQRGDHRILTVPLLAKIRGQIQEADVIIGDITSRNPNVFYELGLADAYGKPVILITQDAADEIPSDIRHLEFIRYDLSAHVEFLAKLDRAVQDLFVHRYEDLFAEAQEILRRCNCDSHAALGTASLEVFQERVVVGERTQGVPERGEPLLRAEFLLPRVVENAADKTVMKVLTDWLNSQPVNSD